MSVHPEYPDPHQIPADVRFQHVCEVCGKTAMLTSGEAYWSGWDYPPEMGVWGAVSPRTCGRCGIDATVWWALMMDHKTADDLTPKQWAAVAKIHDEMPD